jgi:signal transduction histidine kinase
VATGLAGLLSAAAFAVCCMVPAFRTADAFATESYFILAVWGLVACLVFLRLTRQDTSASLGKSIAPWCALLFLIFFSTHMWVRRATSLVTGEVVHEVGVHYASSRGRGRPGEDDPYIRREERIIGNALTQYQFVQMGIVIAALAVMVGIYATVTRRERAAAKAKEYFFSTISHDIRTPLNAIIGYSDTLRLGSSSPADRDEAVSAIAASSRNLLRLVNDILDLSKLASGNLRTAPVPTDCTALLRDVAAIFGLAARQAGLDFRVAVPPMPRLLLDPVRLRQIAFNLVGNAVKFTERGHIEIRASFTPEPGTNAGEFALEIEDTGVGIAEEDIPRVTSAYVQVAAKFARNGGTGVGLAVCRQLVSAMGGTFAVRSALGEGSTFAVSFPRVKTADEEEGAAAHPVPPPAPLPALDAPAVSAAAEPVAAQAAAADGTGMPAPGTRLLLVDDSKMNLMVLKALLKRLGKYDIATAADGNEALSLLRDSGSAPFALVLTDYWMPNLDGAGLVSAIRSDPGLSGIPVQVVTADIELQSSYADKGFDGILLKPVTADVLRPLLPS